MLKFENEIIYTGHQNRTSKQGKEYILINYLDESGQTFGTMAECIIPDNLKQLDRVKVQFGVVTGRYVGLKTLGLQKV